MNKNYEYIYYVQCSGQSVIELHRKIKGPNGQRILPVTIHSTIKAATESGKEWARFALGA